MFHLLILLIMKETTTTIDRSSILEELVHNNKATPQEIVVEEEEEDMPSITPKEGKLRLSDDMTLSILSKLLVGDKNIGLKMQAFEALKTLLDQILLLVVVVVVMD